MKIKSRLKTYLVLISFLSILVQSMGLLFYLSPKVFADEDSEPVSAIDQPARGSIHNSPIKISGSSSDTDTSEEDTVEEEDIVDYVQFFYRLATDGEDNEDEWNEIDSITNEEEVNPLFHWEIAWTPDENGVYDIKVEATDTSDNTEQSPVVENVTYDTIAPTTPVADPAAGDYTSDQSVALSSSDSLSGVDNIFYTTDGIDPSDTNGTVYGGPIAIGIDTILKAIAYDNAGNASDVLTAVYGITPVISSEASSSVSTSSVTITWITDDLSTSRVIYDTVSHSSLGGAPNYGYASSTTEADTLPKVISHSVDVIGLTAGTTYFYRTVSHGSPEAVSSENSFTTSLPVPTPTPTSSTSGGGGGGGGGAGDGKSDGLGCASHDCSGGSPASQNRVLGVSTEQIRSQVLGAATPEATLTPKPTQEILGEEEKTSQEKTQEDKVKSILSARNLIGSAIVLFIVIFLLLIFKRKKSKSQS